MAGKDFLSPVTILAAGDMTGDLASSAVDVMTFDNVGFQFVWTGTPEGDFGVQVSLDGVNWSAYTLSPMPSATGSAGNEYVEINQTTAKFIRATYTATSSTGSLTILISGKMV